MLVVLVIPVVVTPDDYPVATILVPATVQSAVMSIELGARAAVIAIVVVAVASNPEANTLRVRH